MKVLVADDDRCSRLLVSALVMRLGYEVCQASDGLEALACYWHATVLIWLVIFSFFYVLV